ncbi:MAG: CarD family transcriptional regulator, partial [Lachnospiraceae bacterium]|nr:CarD family transcriptional regulator [Lachnospiraceae bacterium]
ITSMDMDGMPRDTMYYILHPMHQNGGRIFVSVENRKTVMRKVLTGEEAKALIREIPDIEELWIANDKVREEKYKECIRTCDCRELVRIIKTLYMRRQMRIMQGKKITATDERYLKLAEDNLYSELSIPLEIPKEDMEKYLTNEIEKMKA